MGDKSSIEWTDATWNPVRGCSRVSEGCRHCYAEAVAARFSDSGQAYYGLAKRKPARWTGIVSLVPEHLLDPLRWKKPRRIFVNSMSDLFHEALTDKAIARVFEVMARAPQHIFQVLTKRPERMRGWVRAHTEHMGLRPWPLPNVWLGVSVEEQLTANARIPVLLETPAALRFVSAEPLLGPIEFDMGWLSPFKDLDPGMVPTPRVDWLIIGGESGGGARPCDPAWVQALVDQVLESEGTRSTHCAVFVKQLGTVWAKNRGGRAPASKGGNMGLWPEALRRREFPMPRASQELF